MWQEPIKEKKKEKKRKYFEVRMHLASVLSQTCGLGWAARAWRQAGKLSWC